MIDATKELEENVPIESDRIDIFYEIGPSQEEIICL